MRRRSRPLQEQQLGAEYGAERRREPVLPRVHLPRRQPLVQDEQDRRAREIAVLPEHFPGNARVAFAQAELLLDVREQLLPSGMQQECGDVASIEAVASQEAVDEPGNLLADQLGNALRADDVESGLAGS